MTPPESTCWTVIQGAAGGNAADQEAFAHRYNSVVRAYLAARWQGSNFVQEVDDAVQEVFVECFKQDGILAKADRARGFRAFLFGAVRNVALRIEAKIGRQRELQPADLDLLAAADESLSKAFDRAWARAMVRDAARIQGEKAQDETALRRAELLRLRFHDGLPIREIARRWQTDAAVLHHEYAKARQEFKTALLEVVGFYHPGGKNEIELECSNLLSILG